MKENLFLPPNKIKILIIDDDRIIQLVIKHALQEQGYEIILANNGVKGLELAYKHSPALIICDWQMDDIDGLEVCRKIKSEPSLSTTFFILLTSRKAVEDRVEGLDTGADDFLSKPIEINELNARVRAGLRLYQMNQQLQKLAQDLQLQKHLLEAELNEAADYVKSLLPQPMSGLIIINSRFLPSRQLGGDCFDYYWLDENHLVIYLLDVSGHVWKYSRKDTASTTVNRGGNCTNKVRLIRVVTRDSLVLIFIWKYLLLNL